MDEVINTGVSEERDRLLQRLAELEAFEWLDKEIEKHSCNQRMTRRLTYLRELAIIGRDQPALDRIKDQSHDD